MLSRLNTSWIAWWASAARRSFRALDRNVPALPLDLFRVFLGVLFFAYFLQLLWQSEDFSGPGGLIDHGLVQEAFWYTRLSLFHPGISLEVLQGVFCLSCFGALALAAGIRVRLCASLLFAVAVSTYRWNFPVMYLDDGIMHLMLLWTLLLPMGQTLVLREWLNNGTNSWRMWKGKTVPGGATRCFLWNVMLVYFVAGLWKLGSPMWQEGTALQTALQTPAAWVPELWMGSYNLPLTALNYLALAFEVSFPLMLVLPKKHLLKVVLLVIMIGFHVGSVATLRVPFANLALLASTVVLFGQELMDWLNGAASEYPGSQQTPGAFHVSSGLSLVFVALLTLSVMRFETGADTVEPASYAVEEQGMDPRNVGGLTVLHKPIYALLWAAGVAQEYQLFDWIDSRNYFLEYQVVLTDATGARRTVDSAQMFPSSLRGALLQMYLHDLVWFQLPPEYRPAFKQSLLERFPRRFCRDGGTGEDVTARSSMNRIIPGQELDPAAAQQVIFNFRCDSRKVEGLTVSLVNPFAPGDL